MKESLSIQGLGIERLIVTGTLHNNGEERLYNHWQFITRGL